MRRVVLLALLALALPVAASAASVDFTVGGTVGQTVNGTVLGTSGSDLPGGVLTINGALIDINSSPVTPGLVTVTTGTLTSGASNCNAGCSFTGGSLMVWDSSSTLLFSGMFNGTLTTDAAGDVQVNAALGGFPVLGGFDLVIKSTGTISGDFPVATPEPGTLGLLGTGLLGIAGLVRRKLIG